MLRNLIILGTLTLCLSACMPSAVTVSHDTPLIDPTNVAKIQKGTTTVAEVEALFGKPVMVSLMGDGRRMAFYSSYNVTSTGQTDPKAYIPFVGPILATSTGQATSRQQTLQIIYTAAGIVQDYVFNDNTNNMNTRFGVTTGLQTETVPAPTAGSPSAP